MANYLAALLLTAGLTLSATSLRAQAPAPPAYAGPRYPGGPDSLRALVGRSIRQTVPPPSGRMLVQFELRPDGRPTRYTMLRPPGPLNKPLVEATAKALDYLEAHMPAWQPAPPDPETTTTEAPKINLVVDFGTPLEAQPYPYADQNPVFGTLVQALPARIATRRDKLLADPVRRDKFQSSLGGLVAFTQMQVLYPAEALRNQQQGTVYASFQVAENGSIEQLEILGTAGRALDAEVRRALQQLPAATAPAQFQSKPVRVSYVLPITFRVM